MSTVSPVYRVFYIVYCLPVGNRLSQFSVRGGRPSFIVVCSGVGASILITARLTCRPALPFDETFRVPTPGRGPAAAAAAVQHGGPPWPDSPCDR